MGELLKIAYVGAGCTGKTELFERSRSSLDQSAVMVDEVAREWFKNHPEVTDKFSFHAQATIQDLVMKKEQIAHELASVSEEEKLIVCDRSVLDAPAYLYSQGERGGGDELFARIEQWLGTYSMIYLLDPADIPHQTDDVRDESEATREIIHNGFLELFHLYGVEHELLSGSTEERLQIVLRYLDELGK